MGLLECGEDEWGAHHGQVCAGPERSLEAIAQGVDLSGWWEFLAPSEDSWPPWGNDFVLIDEAQFPRAWAGKGGKSYKKYERDSTEWSFGCESYLDYPLVEGQENRSPANERVSRLDGCDGTDELRDPSSRRFLDRVAVRAGMMCFYYDYLYFKSSTMDVAIDNVVVHPSICFGYDAVHDQLIVSYSSQDEPGRELRYARYLKDSGDL